MLSQTRKLANWPSGVLVLGRIEFRDVLRHVRRQNAVALPDDEMRGVGRIHHIDGVDVAGIFLADALEHALRAGALDAHRDARIFRLERLGQLLRDRQIGRGVIDDLAFLLRRLDQRRRDRLRRRRSRHHAGRKCCACEQWRRCLAAHRGARSGCSLALPIIVCRAFSAGSLLLGPIHPSLSFIPRTRSQSIVDSSFPLQLDLRQRNKTRKVQGREK